MKVLDAPVKPVSFGMGVGAGADAHADSRRLHRSVASDWYHDTSSCIQHALI